ncbi:SusD/RagB family nutrient-binding outer membrane lipoprotein [Chryseobacterium indologenes]|uniref:SusD/RagB family nutrient-binding outer membrane lipoprotein n=1 Tax=Chryseobacterium indologenes TaxID=253 RepID=UPI000BFD6582|nr:SusD/RagB family nutrient-binding outer membrane lipoprotein [Chryseobacterium indologenes]ATN06555.1 SusD/RagB family nutrient-binding outer membrane lipoprotein [Chryseobacterium indologenes]AYY84684.1 SusD/RagB family nutrient-binding outer membrane lipoprotein [Chryseobacterium indologenes]QIX81569.1 SusD/RagB family nutrient-binding outer membrane lipoprotein [Chryseobacterium indologenes]UDQ55326.1 SusD/RagB family nutrient-binding outer membrane lipoprotein [Chryseobacterium indologen
MKKIFSIIAVVGLSLAINSCADKFDEIDVNPNSTENPLPTGLFNNGNKEYMDYTRDGWVSGRMMLPFVQYSAQRQYTEEDRYQYRLTTGTRLWTRTYYVAQDYKKIIDLNTDPASKVKMLTYGSNENQIAAARIMLSYVFANLADAFGDIPYYSYGNKDADFQALNIDATLQPKFGTQAKVYADILKELKEASEMIDFSQKTVFSEGDQLFKSPAKLKKFANSLRLRIATRVRGVVPGAEAHIADAIASGVMTSNDDTVGLTYENNLVNPSPFFSTYIERSDFAISKTFVQLLKGESGVFGVDPRIFKYASPVDVRVGAIRSQTMYEATNIDEIQGMPYGVPSTLASSQAGSESFFGKSILKPGATEIFMEYAEVEFLLSEANGWSQDHYEKGVRASMQRWGVDATKINTFVNALPAASKANVMTQKYIALFMQPNEAWSEYRRTGYPNTLLKPGQTAELNIPSASEVTTYTFTSLIAGLKDVPTRIFYPTNVQTLNTANYQAASANIGGDKMDTKLIWDKD